MDHATRFNHIRGKRTAAKSAVRRPIVGGALFGILIDHEQIRRANVNRSLDGGMSPSASDPYCQ